MNDEAFYRYIQQRAQLSTLEEARQAAQLTLRSMKQVLSREAVDGLVSQLPQELAFELDGASGQSDDMVDKELFIGRMMNNLETEYLWDQSFGGLDLVSVHTGDDAARITQSVFSAIKETVDPRTAQAVEASLPADVGEWFRFS